MLPKPVTAVPHHSCATVAGLDPVNGLGKGDSLAAFDVGLGELALVDAEELDDVCIAKATIPIIRTSTATGNVKMYRLTKQGEVLLRLLREFNKQVPTGAPFTNVESKSPV